MMIASIGTGNVDEAASRVAQGVSEDETERKGATRVIPTPHTRGLKAKSGTRRGRQPVPTKAAGLVEGGQTRRALPESQTDEHSWVVTDALVRTRLGVLRKATLRFSGHRLSTQRCSVQRAFPALWVIPLAGTVGRGRRLFESPARLLAPEKWSPARLLESSASGQNGTTKKCALTKKSGTNTGRRKLEFLCRFLSH